MDVTLGKPVVSRDGQKVGVVSRLVVDPDTEELRELMVHHGILLTKDRLVDLGLIEDVDSDGTVHLNVTAAQADRLPVFVEYEYIAHRSGDVSDGLYPIWPGPGPGSTVLVRTGHPSGGYLHSTRGLGEPSTIEMPPIEVQSNLSADMVAVGAGTDVVDKTGRRIGTLGELIYDNEGETQAIVVRAGLVFHHSVTVPMKQVASMTHEAICLSITAEEAELASRSGPNNDPDGDNA
ncbi:MAG TPA: PRC-barrel domain-containing protein [Thermomicrobiaceae bacterium]|nr:PRC-barrel domain-containing protein [Thermomicrobiaceae bacterium]